MERPLTFTRNETAGDGAIILSVSGEVDLLTADDFAAQVKDAAMAPHRLVVIDLSDVHFLGSAALSVLLSAAENARSEDIDFRIVASERIILRPLEITGICSEVEVFDSVEAALNRRDE